jgi:hypothetical protein
MHMPFWILVCICPFEWNFWKHWTKVGKFQDLLRSLWNFEKVEIGGDLAFGLKDLFF